MQCFTATRCGVSSGIAFSGDSLEFNDSKLILTERLKKDSASVCRRSGWRRVFDWSHIVLRCSMQLDRAFSCARLLPPKVERESQKALVLLYLPDISLGWHSKDFELEGRYDKVFTRYSSQYLGSDAGTYWYLIVLEKGEYATFRQKDPRARWMNDVFGIFFDGETLIHSTYQAVQPFQSSTIIG